MDKIGIPTKEATQYNEWIELAAYLVLKCGSVNWEHVKFHEKMRHWCKAIAVFDVQLKVCLPREMAHILDSLDNELEASA